MRTIVNLPDALLRRAKITAVERGCSLRQLITDALLHEIEHTTGGKPLRMTRPPLTLPADAPLRTLGLDTVRQLDTEAVLEADTARIHCINRARSL